ncbi:histidine ammonia-lyase [Ekhidna sp.]|uniref:histidine ammonia-lyase n=1 Tax=Ekhidna sp. TaxID=2608089 RepID=UPI003296E51B
MAATPSIFNYGEDHLTAGIALSIAKGNTKGILSKNAREAVNKSADAVKVIADGEQAVYGINTGFGPLCTTQISKAETNTLQKNLLMSHAVGLGEPIRDEIAKLMMILKVHALAKGFSGVKEETIDRIIFHIDNNIIPLVPEQGSVGASGDLAPLSHLFLPLIGLGKVKVNGSFIDTGQWLEKEGIKQLDLGAKEGLGLINGTQFIAAHAIKIVEQLQNVLVHADISGAMMIEGLLASVKPFSPELHQIRAYKGNGHVAAFISNLLDGSEVVHSHASCARVQDPYSLRCMPQVHGASRNAWLHVKEMLEIEINSVTDNPIVFSSDHTISGGNFHGQPMALPIDYACLAAAEIGSISDRRIYLSLEGDTPGVPKLLLSETGTNSGFMIPQYTTAALASENKGLCFPASADSIPTSLGQEDHVSMGSIGGRKALKVVENVEKIIGVEIFCAAQALDFHRPLKSSKIMASIHDHVRTKIAHITKDGVMNEIMETAIEMVKNKELIDVARAAAKKYSISLETEFSSEFDLY